MDIVRNTVCTKVIIENKKAVGVNILSDGRKIKIRVRKEVILSVFGSPQLLMLSGIGPQNHLKEMNIPVIKNLPVGDNLHDRVTAAIFYRFHKTSSQAVTPLDPINGLYEYLTTRKGIYSSLPINFHAFLNVGTKSNYPDVHYKHFTIKKFSTDLATYMNVLKFKTEIVEILDQNVNESEIGVVLVSITNPKSRGNVRLTGNNISDNPKIYLDFFENDDDMKLLIKAIKKHVALTEKKTFIKNEVELINLPLPECNQYRLRSNDYYRCYIRHMTMSYFQPVGACRMAPETMTRQWLIQYLKLLILMD